MDKVLSFKPWIGKVKTGLSTGGFTVICPSFSFLFSNYNGCRKRTGNSIYNGFYVFC